MKTLITGGTCSAAVLAMSMAVFAQTTQTPTQPPTGSPTAQEPAAPAASSEARQQTITGCVQREADYRRAKGAGGGGAAGTGAGVGNEFVLVNASPSTGSTAAREPGEPTPGAQEAVGTSGATGQAFELTGSGEGQLEQYVGKRVEIIGKMKESSGASDRPTGATAGGATTGTGSTAGTSGTATGTASGRPPATGGADVMGQELNLKEFEVVSVREASGSCPPSER